MEIVVGSRVVYKGEEYHVVWVYENGNVEIAKKGQRTKIDLVPIKYLNKLD
ncbi:hypothetical protein [Fictibacillus phosphorivorans]|uniref:hypothetical protein n=1 Tax=Fictibacillus phosphorivorans TaxID=1221500 RepID=UPI00203C3411|nr:hypothetical protein [Fictibacillus phosphorivorans]MCM3720064.1 hypothetical protein [Fictibacillus phosphorivorans]MCM3777737.1 hypothetical protein [Fictibacillus phosphorivorans]